MGHGSGHSSTFLYLAARYATDELGARILVIVADPVYLAIHLYRSMGFADAERQVLLQGS
jgi:hypothetical protein